MRMLKLAFAAGVLFALTAVGVTACDPGDRGQGISPAEAALSTCENFKRLWNVAIDHTAQGDLNVEQIELVDKAVAIATPYCTGSAPNVKSDYKDIAIHGAVGILSGVLAAFL